MPWRPGTIERAYQLARSGGCRNARDIKARLWSEGYLDADRQLVGALLARDLRRLCRAACATHSFAADRIRDLAQSEATWSTNAVIAASE